MREKTLAPHLLSIQDMGDLSATPGSTAWARAVRSELSILISQETSSVRHVRDWLRALQDTTGYKQLDDADGYPFQSLKDFAITAPPFGLGFDPDIVVALLEETRELVLGASLRQYRPSAQELAGDKTVEAMPKHGGDRKSEESRLYNNLDDRGTSAAYLVKRLKRDAPEVAAALARGEHKSARAAGIAAGIIQLPTRVEQTIKLWKKMTTEERAQFLLWLDTQREEVPV